MCFQILSPSWTCLCDFCHFHFFIRRGLGEMHPKMLFGMSSLWTGAFAPTICIICMDLQSRDPFLRAFVPNESQWDSSLTSQISLAMCVVLWFRDFVVFERYFHLCIYIYIYLSRTHACCMYSCMYSYYMYSSESLASRVLDGHWKGRIHNRHLRIQLSTSLHQRRRRRRRRQRRWREINTMQHKQIQCNIFKTFKNKQNKQNVSNSQIP